MPAPEAPRGSYEQAPLLSPTRSEASLPIPGLSPEKKKKPWVVLVVLIFFLVAIIDVGSYMAEAPKARVYEANICVRYYQENDPSKIRDDGTVEERLCKEDQIQKKLAMVFGWQDTFDAIPSLLLAVPFGALADKYGRKWIFAMGLMGLQFSMAWILLICYFRSLPLQLTWFSSVFFTMGGGPLVATAIAFTMMSDIVPPDKRTSVFLYLTAGILISELIAPIMASRLMEHGDWIPLLLALGIQQAGVMLAVVFPETLHLRDLPEPREEDEQDIELRPVEEQGVGFKAQMRHFKDAFMFLRKDTTVALVIFTFMANRLGRQVLTMLIRYASKRYHWKIQKAAYLVSFRAATNLVSLMVFIPLVNLILVKLLQLPAHHADIWIARGSIILTTTSFFIMGVAAHPTLLILGLLVYNLGTGFNAAMRSTSIHLVGGQSSPDIGRLFAVIAVMEAVGVMIAGPLLAQLFEWGINQGEPWIGLPFLGSAVVFAIIAVVTFVISIKDKEVVYMPVEDDEAPTPMGSPSGRRHLD